MTRRGFRHGIALRNDMKRCDADQPPWHLDVALPQRVPHGRRDDDQPQLSQLTHAVQALNGEENSP